MDNESLTWWELLELAHELMIPPWELMKLDIKMLRLLLRYL
jgi:hypothetical protein